MTNSTLRFPEPIFNLTLHKKYWNIVAKYPGLDNHTLVGGVHWKYPELVSPVGFTMPEIRELCDAPWYFLPQKYCRAYEWHLAEQGKLKKEDKFYCPFQKNTICQNEDNCLDGFWLKIHHYRCLTEDMFLKPQISSKEEKELVNEWQKELEEDGDNKNELDDLLSEMDIDLVDDTKDLLEDNGEEFDFKRPDGTVEKVRRFDLTFLGMCRKHHIFPSLGNIHIELSRLAKQMADIHVEDYVKVK